jgi:hypothetical protein
VLGVGTGVIKQAKTDTKMMFLDPLFIAAILLIVCQKAQAFTGGTKSMASSPLIRTESPSIIARGSPLPMALGDFTVELNKPLGIILQECDNASGVQVKELVEGGAAASNSNIVPGDVLLQVNDNDVSALDFDSVMDQLISLDESSPARLTIGDGLGQLDMPKNVVKLLKTTEDAFFIDAVVRQAVREMRKQNQLGDLLKVEVIIGAGVSEEGKRGQARFFAIFSTGGATSYSCNVSATGLRQEDGSIDIVSLSAAKDEGLGQTFDFI